MRPPFSACQPDCRAAAAPHGRKTHARDPAAPSRLVRPSVSSMRSGCHDRGRTHGREQQQISHRRQWEVRGCQAGELRPLSDACRWFSLVPITRRGYPLTDNAGLAETEILRTRTTYVTSWQLAHSRPSVLALAVSRYTHTPACFISCNCARVLASWRAPRGGLASGRGGASFACKLKLERQWRE